MRAPVYIYCAALYSPEGIIQALLKEGRAAPAARDMQPEDVLDQIAGAEGFDREDEKSFDSDEFPKGPYEDGGGEADCPQHCDATRVFLENPLTRDGYAYVREAAAPFEREALASDNPPDPEDGEYAYSSRIAEVARGDSQGQVVAQWLDFYPEAYHKANGGPC